MWLIERTFGTTDEPDAEGATSSWALHNVSRNRTDSNDDPIRVTLKRWDPAAGTFPEVLLVVKS